VAVDGNAEENRGTGGLERWNAECTAEGCYRRWPD